MLGMENLATRSAWPGPPLQLRIVHLKRQLKKKLRRLVPAGTTENRMATRARVVLLRDKGVPIEVIARRLGCLKVASIEGLTRPPESSKAATVTARAEALLRSSPGLLARSSPPPA